MLIVPVFRHLGQCQPWISIWLMDINGMKYGLPEGHHPQLSSAPGPPPRAAAAAAASAAPRRSRPRRAHWGCLARDPPGFGRSAPTKMLENDGFHPEKMVDFTRKNGVSSPRKSVGNFGDFSDFEKYGDVCGDFIKEHGRFNMISVTKIMEMMEYCDFTNQNFGVWMTVLWIAKVPGSSKWNDGSLTTSNH